MKANPENPRSCGSMKTAAKAVAVFHIVFSILIIIGAGIVLLAGTFVASTAADRLDAVAAKEIPNDPNATSAVMAGSLMALGAVLVLFMGFFGLMFSCMLYSGVTQKNTAKLWVWIILNAIGVSFLILGMITNVSSAGGPFYDGMGLDLLHIVLGIFFCSIIYAFIQEVNQEKANAVEAGNPRIAYKSKETV